MTSISDSTSNNRKIAKNTGYLYIRMIFTMLVTLYTSRVILDVLGVNDYGLYQAVGGIVAFLSFLNNALSTGTSRFIAYELGAGKESKLKRTFATTLSVHLIISLIVVIVAETVGLWFVKNKLVIPESRYSSAVFVYHFSILASVFTLITVPYNAVIIAREKMSFFAYMSIAEVMLKLGIVFVLTVTPIDKLRLYSVLLCLVQISIFLCYRFFCRHYFPEAKTKPQIDRGIFKEVIGFSSWSLCSGCTTALNNQGIIVLLNIFFSSPVVVARSISLQVNSAANQFVSNFRTAVNPQIVKYLAVNDRTNSQRLLLQSTKYSYYLMLVICLPVFFLSYQILHLWLGQVPNYSVIFLRLVMIQSLFQVFDTSFYTALYAEGRLKENALISPTIGIIAFVTIFFLFKTGSSPVSMSWVFLLYYAILGCIVKPLLITKISFYNINEINQVLWVCLKVTLCSLPIPVSLFFSLPLNSISGILVLLFSSVISVVLSILFLGIDKSIRKLLFSYLSAKFIRHLSSIVR